MQISRLHLESLRLVGLGWEPRIHNKPPKVLQSRVRSHGLEQHA